ncbi:uncharacterized protein FIBRA_03727 [Fibroporia radiculosa]|uniref:Uncharacterized protein n=1 Tax=Fibroporia radiculosa TaxID=599839 RepID=J4H2K1_9APHY|nr:uncharacterized protein FIBRA_03727 [Fibroporia radiculosa]CCM01664.1 predicted protein [Fibroporia radiculosa]
MALTSDYNASFMGATFNDWMTTHQWAGACGSPNTSVVMVATVPQHLASVTEAGSEVETIRVVMHYQKRYGTLDECNVYLVVPGFGRTLVCEAYGVQLERDTPRKYTVAIPNSQAPKIHGNFSWKFEKQQNQIEVVMAYDLTTPFTGQMVDHVSLFPSSVSARQDQLQQFPYEIATKPRSTIEDIDDLQSAVHFDAVTSGEHELLVKFLDDHAHDMGDAGYTIAIQSYREGGPVVGVASSDSGLAAAASKQYSLSLHFAGILELVGSIGPVDRVVAAELFAKVPIAGRVKLANVKGALTDTASVQATINVVVAKGTVTFRAVKNDSGKHDLYCDATVQVKLISPIKVTNVKILALP